VKSDKLEFNKLKSFRMLINKQDRLIKNGWRNGILGVDVPGNDASEFYSENA
jgi:hypothetical protein